MSVGPRVRSVNLAEEQQRPVLIPAVNAQKPMDKLLKKAVRSPESEKEKKKAQLTPTLSPPMRNLSAPSSLRHGSQLLRRNLSMNASCSSDASSDSSHSRASTGRISRSSVPSLRRKQGVSKLDKVYNNGSGNGNYDDGDDRELVGEMDGFGMKKRCAWVTPSTEDPSYASFHDEEWGIPVHDDNKLFELLSLSVALAELNWPTILHKRSAFKEVFLEFNPVSVSKLNEKKICSPGTPGSSLLSEMKLRNIVENARQVCKIKNEFGSFDKYIWGFMNQRPQVNKFRYSRQVPVKTSKAEMISKDLVRRGFRGVGPTVVYSFMQAAGLTNDHLTTCFRFHECVLAGEELKKDDQATIEVDKPVDMVKLELTSTLDEISICSD